MERDLMKRTVGGEIVNRLKGLNAAIKSGESISARFTCNRVILDLRPREYDPKMVKKIRKSLGVSQALFAQFIGVSTSAVRSWEQGTNPVPGMACRFMDEIHRDPPYWLNRLSEAVVDKQLAKQ